MFRKDTGKDKKEEKEQKNLNKDLSENKPKISINIIDDYISKPNDQEAKATGNSKIIIADHFSATGLSSIAQFATEIRKESEDLKKELQRLKHHLASEFNLLALMLARGIDDFSSGEYKSISKFLEDTKETLKLFKLVIQKKSAEEFNSNSKNMKQLSEVSAKLDKFVNDKLKTIEIELAKVKPTNTP